MWPTFDTVGNNKTNRANWRPKYLSYRCEIRALVGRPWPSVSEVRGWSEQRYYIQCSAVSQVPDTLWGLVEPLKRSTLLPRPTTAAAVHAVAGSRIIYTACYTRSAGTNAKCVTAAYLHLSLSCAQRVPAVSLPLCVKESGLCYQVSQRSTDLNLGPNKMQRVKATFTFFINRRVVTLLSPTLSLVRTYAMLHSSGDQMIHSVSLAANLNTTFKCVKLAVSYIQAYNEIQQTVLITSSQHKPNSTIYPSEQSL